MFLVAPDRHAGSADTYGWDTVSAVRVGDMNVAIAIAGTSPGGFRQTVSGYDVGASFGDWRIGTGGDGKLVHMRLPMATVEVVADGKTVKVGDAEAEIEVHLNFLPHEVPQAEPGAGRLLKLMVDPRGEKPVSVIEIDYDKRSPLAVRSAVFAALDAWLVANLDKFRHVFACVNIDRVVEADAFPWLQPSFVSYACATDGEASERSQFGVLCQTAGRKADGLVEQIGPDVIPKNCAAGFLISQQRFTKDMLVPALKATFLKGAKAKEITETDTSLKFEGELKLNIVEADGKTYDPYLEKLTAEVHQTSLHMETVTKTWIMPGIWSMSSYKADYVFGLIANSKNEKTIGFQMDGEPDNDSWPEHSEGIVIAEIILALIGLIVLAVMTAVSFGLLTVPALAIGAVLVGTTAAAMTIGIADLVASGDGPPLSLMLANATDAISWAHGSAFDPEYVALNDSLQFGGTLKPEAALRAAQEGRPLAAAAREEIRAFQDRFGAYEDAA